MRPRHPAPRPAFLTVLLVALGSAAPAFAQTGSNFLAVSELDANGGYGQVQIYTQDTNGQSPALQTTISGHGLAFPMGLAYDSGSNSLLIADLGNRTVWDYSLTSQTLSPLVTVSGHIYLNDLLISNGTLYVSAYDSGTVGSPGAVLAYSLTHTGGSLHAALETTYAGGNLQGPTGLSVDGSGHVYVNGSIGGHVGLFSLPTPGSPAETPSQVTLTGGTLSAPAGMAFVTSGGNNYLIETNFFNGNNYAASLVAYTPGTSTFTYKSTGSGTFSNPTVGGPGDVVANLGSLPNQLNLLVSDAGDHAIWQYAIKKNGDFVTPSSPYLQLASNLQPTYLVQFDPPAISAVPEPSSLALLGLGGGAGVLAYRRKRRAGASA